MDLFITNMQLFNKTLIDGGVMWIIVMFLSAVQSLAPIHCRVSIGEQIM